MARAQAGEIFRLLARLGAAIILWAGLAGTAHAADCAALLQLSLPHAAVTSAAVMDSGSFTDDTRAGEPSQTYASLPAFCRVRGVSRPTSNSEIHFEIWLPEPQAWTGRLFMVGNGAYASYIYYAQMAQRIRAGAMAVATDGGHQGGWDDLSFGVGHPEKIADFAGRAGHESVVAGKAAASAYFGSAPRYSYMCGCSTGGYQALTAAQRYPDDFDGLIAGDPGNNRSTLNMQFLWNYLANHRPGDDGTPILSADDLVLLHEAVVNACDALDGVADGVINDPRDCKFDLQTLLCPRGQITKCLSRAQIDAARKIYQGPTDARTGQPIYPGFPFGSEGVATRNEKGFPGWSAYWADQAHPNQPSRTDFFRLWVFEDPKWDWWHFNWGSDVDFVHAKMAETFDANSTDLSAFKAHGGKLIMFMGWSDPVGTPFEAINYYEHVQARAAGTTESARRTATQSFLRLYMIPGMAHCAEGEGAVNFSTATRDSTPPVSDATHDMAAALQEWVEKGTPPQALIATKYAEGDAHKIAFQRPLCVFPGVAKYRGGPTDRAESFACELPHDDAVLEGQSEPLHSPILPSWQDISRPSPLTHRH